MTDLKIKGAAGKVPLGLIPLRALYGLARVLEYGNKKYAPRNWREADGSRETVERYLHATLRHMAVVQEGASVNPLRRDDESGLPHLDHAIASLVILRDILCNEHPHDPGVSNDPPPPPEKET